MTNHEKNALGMRVKAMLDAGDYGRGPSIDELIAQRRRDARKQGAAKFLLLLAAGAVAALITVWAWDRDDNESQETKDSRAALIESQR